MLNIKTWRDPYDAGFSPCKPKEITLEPGLTVLVGCNGCGKTTLLRNIKEWASGENIPCHLFDNLSDGGNTSIGSFLAGYGTEDDFALGLEMMSSSEGERIRLNLNAQQKLYKQFFDEGIINNMSYRIASSLGAKKTVSTDKRRILLFDAVDSGLSIDTVCDVKASLHALIDTAAKDGIEPYIVIAANEYELCDGEACFDVNMGKYIAFADYDAYKKFIIKSRERKISRYKQQAIWEAKRRESEKKRYDALKGKAIEEANAILEKERASELHGPKYRIEYELHSVFRNLYDYARGCRDGSLVADVDEIEKNFLEAIVEIYGKSRKTFRKL